MQWSYRNYEYRVDKIERLNITSMSNDKREFVPDDQVSPLPVAYCTVSILRNFQHEPDVCRLSYVYVKLFLQNDEYRNKV